MSTKTKESIQVKRARKKLQKQLQEEEKMVTPQALRKMSESIHLWLSRHSEERIPLKDKNITLFDENQHSAKIRSRFVTSLLKELGRDQDPSSLEGRIKPDLPPKF